MKKNITDLTDKLGYTFKNKALLEQALRHRSSGGGVASNERLEFLGDATLGLIMALELYKQYSNVEEGELSRFRANLVNGVTLTVLAQDFALGDYLKLGIGERRSGGSKRTSILADAVEAIIGAIYLDSDFETVQDCVVRWYKPHWERILTAEQKDAKTRLQETLQANGFGLPIYTVKNIEGVSHAQTFHIECKVKGIDEVSYGVGSSKRRAEQDAADKFLKIDGLSKILTKGKK